MPDLEHSCCRLLRLVLALVVFALLVGGCASREGVERASDPAPSEEVIISEGMETMRFEDLSDWVTYADHVVVARVVDESEVAPDRPPGPEYAVHRQLTLAVEEDLHQGPGAAELPTSVTIGALGWLIKEGGSERIPMAPSEGPRLEVGERYLLALVDYGAGGWGYLTASSAFHVIDGQIEVEGFDSEVRAEVAEIGLGRLSAALDETSIDADARPFLELPAPERFEAAYAAEAAREAAPTGTSSPPTEATGHEEP